MLQNRESAFLRVNFIGLFIIVIISCVSVCGCWKGVCHSLPWWSEENLQELVPGDETQVLRFGDKCPHPLNHLDGPISLSDVFIENESYNANF